MESKDIHFSLNKRKFSNTQIFNVAIFNIWKLYNLTEPQFEG